MKRGIVRKMGDYWMYEIFDADTQELVFTNTGFETAGQAVRDARATHPDAVMVRVEKRQQEGNGNA